MKCSKGFSTLEILLAGAIFVVFSWGVIEVLLSVLSTDRLAQETTVAANYASEGMEAVRVIKENSFDNLVPTSGSGLTKQDDTWVFDGTENIFDGTYTRTIVVEEAERDGDGSLVESGGSVDPDTMRVTVTVSWQIGPARQDSVVLATYFTRWHTTL